MVLGVVKTGLVNKLISPQLLQLPTWTKGQYHRKIKGKSIHEDIIVSRDDILLDQRTEVVAVFRA
jgi:hypothetical protein